MFYQWLVVGLIVALAACFVVRQTVRTWSTKKSGSCAGGCGCAKPAAEKPADPTFVPVDQLTVRPRPR